jgi:hypothetical protein
MIFELLGIPQSELAKFPQQKQRRTSMDDLDPRSLATLLAIYGETARSMDELPGVFLRGCCQGTTPHNSDAETLREF